MAVMRIRTEVTDERGRLAGLCAALASCGGDILGVDVQLVDGRRVADEFVVELPDGCRREEVTAALERAGAVDVHLEGLGQRGAVDLVARALGVAALVCVDVEAGVARLVGADRARLVDEEASPATALLRRAAESGAPAVERVLGGAGGGAAVAAWTLVVPHVAGDRRRFMVVERTAPAFSSSEVARVSALLGLAGAARADARSLAESARLRVGPPRPVRRRPAAFPFRSRAASAIRPGDAGAGRQRR